MPNMRTCTNRLERLDYRLQKGLCAAVALLLPVTFANAGSVDVLLILDKTGDGYTLQQTVDAGAGSAAITLAHTVSSAEYIPMTSASSTDTVDGTESGAAGEEDVAGGQPETASSRATQTYSLDTGSLIVRYQHHFDSELKLLDDNTREFKLSSIVASVQFSDDTPTRYSAMIILPPELEFAHGQTTGPTPDAETPQRNLSIRTTGEQPFPLPIRFRYVDSDNDGIADLTDRCPDSAAQALVDRTGCEPDVDHDGITDIIDLCPQSAPGALVDGNGCEPDADGDGLADRFDQCDATPANYRIGENGCALDSDADGVVDDEDQCPDSEPQEPVTQQGCSLDFDNDGVPNYRDQCSSTAYGRSVNSLGCEPDADSDGVIDRLDVCPASPLNIAVDSAGCAEDLDNDSVPDYRDACLADQVTSKQAGSDSVDEYEPFGCKGGENSVVLSGITFATNSFFLPAEARVVLDRVARLILHLQPAEFEISAHTDNVGKTGYNAALSQSRADTVRQYLMIRGVSPNLITAKGYGESKPIAPNSTRSNRQRNRRVELLRLPGK